MTDVISATVAGLRGPGLTPDDRALLVEATGQVESAAAVLTSYREALTADTDVDYLGVTTPVMSANSGGAGAVFMLLDAAPRDKTYVIGATFAKGAGAGSMVLRAYKVDGGAYVTQRSVTVVVAGAAAGVVVLGRDQVADFYLDEGEFLAFRPVGFGLVFAGSVTHGSGQGLRLDGAERFDSFDATVTPGSGAAPFQIRADIAGRQIIIDKEQLADDRSRVSVVTSIVGTIAEGPTITLGPDALAAGSSAGGAGGTFYYADPIEKSSTVDAFTMWPPQGAAGIVSLRSFKLIGGERVLHRRRDYPVPGNGARFSVAEDGLNGLFIEAGEILGVAMVGTAVRFQGPATPQRVAYVAGTEEKVSAAVIAAAASAPGATDFQMQVVLTERTATGSASGSRAIIAWGDSLTAGDGGTPYPTQLAALIGRAVSNRGVGGQRLPDILARFGSYQMVVAPPDGVIPASGGFDFFFPYTYDAAQPITANNADVEIAGSLGGVGGHISYSSGGWHFTREADGQAARVGTRQQFVEEVADGRYYATNLFCVGTNSVGLQDALGASYDQQFKMVIDGNARAIDALRGERQFLVMPPAMRQDEYPGSTATRNGAQLNGGQAYDLKIAIEDELRSRWPHQFVNHRSAVFESFDPTIPADVAAHAANKMPPSKLNDIIHYNSAGYAVMARNCFDRGRVLGYW